MAGIPATQAALAAQFPTASGAGSFGAQQVQNLVSSVPFFNIIRAPFRIDQPPYNAKCDWNGTSGTDDSAAWTACIADLNTQGYGDIKIASGVSVCQLGIIKLISNSSLTGSGSASCGVYANLPDNVNSALIDASGTATAGVGNQVDSVVIADLNLGGGQTTAPMLRTYYLKHSIIQRVHSTFGSFGSFLDAVQLWDTFISDIQLDGVGQGVGSTSMRFRNASSATPGAFGYSSDNCNQIYISNVRSESFEGRALAIEQGSVTSELPYGFYVKNFKAESIFAISDPFIMYQGFNSSFREMYLAMIGWLSGTVPIYLLNNSGGGGNIFDGIYMNQGVSGGTIAGILANNASTTQADDYNNISMVFTGTAPSSGAVINNTNQANAILGGFLNTIPADFPIINSSASGWTQAITANATTITVPWQGTSIVLTVSSTFTGQIMQAGLIDGQEITLLNNSANAITWNTTDATSRVKGSTTNNVAGNTAQKLIWNLSTALWWPVK